MRINSLKHLMYTNVLTVYSKLCWFNLYQKFEIEKYTVCGKLVLPKKNGTGFFKTFFGAQLASKFAWICKYLQASCIQHYKDMHSKM